MLIGQRWEGIRVGFGIGWRREGHEVVERSAVVGCESETLVNCGVNVVEDVEGGIPVAFGWFVVVRRLEGVAWGKVWSRALSKPPNRADYTLILAPLFHERRAVVGLAGFGIGVDGEPRAIGGSIRRDVASVGIVGLDQVSGKASLAEVH